MDYVWIWCSSLLPYLKNEALDPPFAILIDIHAGEFSAESADNAHAYIVWNIQVTLTGSAQRLK